MIHSKLSWLPQANMMSNRASYKIQFLYRIFRTCDGDTKLQYYKTNAGELLLNLSLHILTQTFFASSVCSDTFVSKKPNKIYTNS